MLHYCRNTDADFVSDSGNKIHYVEVQDKDSGDVIEYISFLTEKEAEQFIRINNKINKL